MLALRDTDNVGEYMTWRTTPDSTPCIGCDRRPYCINRFEAEDRFPHMAPHLPCKFEKYPRAICQDCLSRPATQGYYGIYDKYLCMVCAERRKNDVPRDVTTTLEMFA